MNDTGLRRDHKATDQRLSRWVLSAAIVLGWVLGLVTPLSAALVDVLFAFLAGGAALNVVK